MSMLGKLVLLFACLFPWGGLDDKLPALDNLVSYKCIVKGPMSLLDYSRPDGRYTTVYQVTFYASHKSPYQKQSQSDWKLIYAYRKDQERGLKDCVNFSKRLRRALEKRAKGNKKKSRAKKKQYESDRGKNL